MERIDIVLDLKKGRISPKNDIKIQQFDKNCYETFINVQNNGEIYDLSSKTVRVQGIKPDGKSILVQAEITNAAYGMIKISFDEQATIVNGLLRLQLLIFGSNDFLKASVPFLVVVGDSLNVGEEVASTDVFTELVQKLNTLDEWDRYFTETSGAIEQKYTERLNGLDEHLAHIVHLAPPPNGVDDTQNLRDFFALGYKNIKFRKGTYNINLKNINRESLAWFYNLRDISIIGEETIIRDNTNYTISTLTNVFSFNNCKNITITGVECIGNDVINPNDNLSVLGSTFAYFENNCKNIKIDLKGSNLRFGIRSGDYLNGDYGNCSNFDLNIQGSMIGYPVAIYNADNVNAYVEVDGFHRGLYLAGVVNGNIVSKCKNIYGEITHILLTNAITKWNDNKDLREVRGCSNLKINATDNGSTIMHNNTLLVQIALSWVNKSYFDNIEVNFNIISSDGISDKIGGFAIQSAVKAQRPEYQYNFEPFIEFSNILITGNINRVAQKTPTNALGEIFIRAYDSDDVNYEHLPTVKNIKFQNISYQKGSVQTRNFYIDFPCGENVILDNCQFKGVNVSASAKKLTICNSTIGSLTSYKAIDELHNENNYIQNIDMSKVLTIISNTNTIYPFTKKTRTRVMTLPLNGGATYSIPSFLKRGALVKSILAQLSGYKTGGSWTIGVPINTSMFGIATINNSSGYNRFNMLNYGENAFPKLFNADTNLVITFLPSDNITYPTGTLTVFIEEELYDVT